VEYDHDALVRVADAQGRPDPDRPTMPGRFSGDGQRLLSAALDGGNAAVVLARSVGAPQGPVQPLARVEFPLKVAHLLALESDAAGRIFLAALLYRAREVEPFDVVQSAEALVVLDPDGRELTRLMFPPSIGPEEQFRPFILGANGAVYQLGFDQSGITLRRFVP
jgi:hypothetical protein